MEVYPWIVLSREYFIPGFFDIMEAIGVMALVVQEALLVILLFSIAAILTLGVAVTVSFSSFAGADKTTLFAPAFKWALAFSYDVKKPVDSTTISMFNSRAVFPDSVL